MSVNNLNYILRHKNLQRLRRRAFVNQDCLCFYCQLPMWEDNQEKFASSYDLPAELAKHLKCTAEHLVARQDKGRDTAGNIVASCLWCNSLRHLGRPNKAPDPITYKSTVTKLIANGEWHPAIRSKSAAISAPVISA